MRLDEVESLEEVVELLEHVVSAHAVAQIAQVPVISAFSSLDCSPSLFSLTFLLDSSTMFSLPFIDNILIYNSFCR